MCTLGTAALLLTTVALAEPPGEHATTALPPDNPFAHESTLPYGLPRFDQIAVEHFRPALLAGMAEHRNEIAAIADNPAAPTFENTIVEMERSGELLRRANAVFTNSFSSNTNPRLEALETEMSPQLAAHNDAIFLDAALYARVRDLYDRRAALGLDPESRRLLERYHMTFVRAGARLSAADKAKLRMLNGQISTLTTEFGQTDLAGANAAAVVVDDRVQLVGLSEAQIAAAAQTAKARGLSGKWAIPLSNTTTQPALSQLKNRALRERIYRASIGRGWGGEFDTTSVIARIAKLRAERAVLLGYPNHASYVLEDETALTTDAVNKMLGQLTPAAVANAKREAAQIQQLIDEQTKGNGTEPFRLEPWDWDFYAEQVRRSKYAYDESEVRPYFEMDRVLRGGVLFAAQELYGLSFKERKDLPLYVEDVRVFEVFDADGAPLGLFLADWYARSNKRGGAWMSSFVEQSRLMGRKAVVLTNLNVPKPAAGQPTLLTFNEVNTAFHEFGHALHGLFSNVQYPQFAGTNVPRDFLEYPSQYNDMWATDPRVLTNYARHYQTGEPMPKTLMDKVLAAPKFNQGYLTTEILAAAFLDQAWHQLPADKTPRQAEIATFEATALEGGGVNFAPVPPRYRSTYFAHIFGSPTGYSAGYYAYIWSEVLARATQHWFDTHGGLRRENGDRLRQKVLARGFSADPLTMFRDFYGRNPEIGPLLEARGLNVEAQVGRHGSVDESS
jgi:peptidyl-dipeptidase Dcp